MRIKRFEAATIQEALRQVKRDLGPEAVILYTKKLKRGGFLGFFGQERAEITAGLDMNIMEARGPSARSAGVGHVGVPLGARGAPADLTESYGGASAAKASPERMRVRLRELNEMRAVGGTGRPAPAAVGTSTGGIDKLSRELVKIGVEEELAVKILQKVTANMPTEERDDERLMLRRIGSDLAGWLRVASGPERPEMRPRVIALIGPTGVGKTTTVAKLAALYQLAEGKQVGIIAADTYRIAASEQIKYYGKIIGCPVEVVMTTQEMKGAMDRLADRDVVLIDTVGRSPRQRTSLEELRSFIEASGAQEVHLIISATTRYYDVLSIIERFGVMPVNRIIFSKVDETDRFGVVLNVAVNFGFPISYITDGQNVPDDLQEANTGKLAEMIMSGMDGMAANH